MKENNFRYALPDGYAQVYHINAKNTATGVILNVIALLLAVAVCIPLALLVDLSPLLENLMALSVALFLTCVGVLLYMVLHELLHGLAYKLTTGRKLTFGVSWSCAFCGVPDIYVTRKTAIIALITPFAIFTVLFIPALILTAPYPTVYAALGLTFGLHVGGCSGDLYVLLLLVFKYTDKRLLMNDTGPEQFFYLPTN